MHTFRLLHVRFGGMAPERTLPALYAKRAFSRRPALSFAKGIRLLCSFFTTIILCKIGTFVKGKVRNDENA